MKVRLLENMLWPVGSITEKGEVIEIPDELAKEWVARKVAERVVNLPSTPPPPEARGKK